MSFLKYLYLLNTYHKIPFHNIEESKKTFDELNDVRTGVGFHFTSNSIMQKILDTGLKPSLGSNSSGGLGKEANDKTFISLGDLS